MKFITSKENPLYKDLKRLATSAAARRDGQRTLIEGIHLAQMYLQHGGPPMMCVVVADEAARTKSLAHQEIKDIVTQCAARGVSCVGLSRQHYNALSALSQVDDGPGILLVISTPAPPTNTHDAHAPLSESAVLLDNVQDPGNVGSILRSAAAAGIQRIVCSPGCAQAWSPKVLRAAMGAHFLLSIVENVPLAEVIANAAVPVFATNAAAATNLYQANLNTACAWIFGHEGQGVSPDLIRLATTQVSIPLISEMESLNVAAAAAVCFFEQRRQQSVCLLHRHGENLNY